MTALTSREACEQAAQPLDVGAAECLLCARESVTAVCPRCKPMIQELPNGLTVLARVAVVR